MLVASPATLRRHGVLGINARNARYVMAYNPRHRYPLVDDKLRTKQLALDMGMAVPELYGVVSHQHEVHRLPSIIAGRDDFVIKPAQGSGGNGVLVIAGRRRNLFFKADGEAIDRDDLAFHVSKTLSGLFSLGGERDRAMIEYRVCFDPLFEKVSYQGVPDVRIIVFLGYPVMAMVRLPTRASDGKANLHQGAIGAGIDVGRGRTLQGVWGNEVIREHPDTGAPIAGLEIPHWPAMLAIAARCYPLSGLGYLGVDLVLDRRRGPLLLELNARPGLNIQLANRQGLRPRLELVEAAADPAAEADARVAFARRHFRHPFRPPAS